MKKFYLIIAALIFICHPGISQDDDSHAIKKMKASADLTVDWLKKNINISDGQAEEFLKILNIPKETIKDLGNLSKDSPDSLKMMEEKLSADIKRDFENVFTPQQWGKYNRKKEEFAKWLEKKLNELGY